jgi:two-component system, OmpR family, KDP operon response regulator KdpE
MTGPRILIIDDETGIRRSLAGFLSRRGFETAAETSGEAALDSFSAHRPDLVLLDLVMPGIGGLETCRQLRARSSVPIIVLSVMDREAEKVAALESGADDYVTKPFGPNELVARMRVALGHRAGLASGRELVYEVADLVVDVGRRRVTLAGRDLHLTPTEYTLLRVLAVAGGRTITHGQLLREIWGPEQGADIQPLRFAAFQLRKKLGDNPLHPRYLVTEPGIGYRLADARNGLA